MIKYPIKIIDAVEARLGGNGIDGKIAMGEKGFGIIDFNAIAIGFYRKSRSHFKKPPKIFWSLRSGWTLWYAGTSATPI